jgi:hypothetical protein
MALGTEMRDTCRILMRKREENRSIAIGGIILSDYYRSVV